MLGRSSSDTVKSETPIGVAISRGSGIYANEIMNARDSMERTYSDIKNVNLSLATFGSGSTLGAYGDGTVYLARKFAQNQNLTDAMISAGNSGFHPKIGNKTGAEAVTAHELGHYLGERASAKSGISAREIVDRAGKTIGVKVNNVASKISEYARYNYDETIAEAFSDVYCNGNKASKASIAITNEIKKILK